MIRRKHSCKSYSALFRFPNFFCFHSSLSSLYGALRIAFSLCLSHSGSLSSPILSNPIDVLHPRDRVSSHGCSQVASSDLYLAYSPSTAPPPPVPSRPAPHPPRPALLPFSGVEPAVSAIFCHSADPWILSSLSFTGPRSSVASLRSVLPCSSSVLRSLLRISLWPSTNAPASLGTVLAAMHQFSGSACNSPVLYLASSSVLVPVAAGS